MIRYIDLDKATNGLLHGFAFFDTVTDRFIQDSYGDQSWDSIDEMSGIQPDFRKRIERLLPDMKDKP